MTSQDRATAYRLCSWSSEIFTLVERGNTREWVPCVSLRLRDVGNPSLFLPNLHERSHPEPAKHQCEPERQCHTPGSCMPVLILRVLADHSDGTHGGNAQEHRSGHLQPQLMRHISEGTHRRSSRAHGSFERTALADLLPRDLGGDSGDHARFPHRRTETHASILTVWGATMTRLCGRRGDIRPARGI